MLAVTALAAGLRLVGLSQPPGLVFDEIFYAQNGCVFALGADACGLEGLVSRAHPPLGTWMVASGIAIFGNHELGWRISSAVAGTLGVAGLYVLTSRLLRGIGTPMAASVGAAAAALLLAVDPLHLVLSRVAMLDAFVTLLALATIGFAIIDADHAAGRASRGRGMWQRLTIGRPWRLATGVALGMGLAVKWSGAYAALGAVAIIVLGEVAARRQPGEGWRTAFGRALRAEWLPSVVLLGVVPGVVYLLSYAGTTPGGILDLPWREGSWWRAVAEHQVAMLRFHLGLEGSHPYESPPWSWLLLKRPVAFWFRVEGGMYREVLALGSPLAWWGGAIGLVILVGRRLRQAALAKPVRVVLIAVAATYGPWLVLSGSRSQVFIWYLLPTIPFLYAGLGILAAEMWGQSRARLGLAVAGLALLVSTVFWWPILTAQPLTPADWWNRIWFADCARPGAETLDLPDDTINSGPPPSGWCWI